MSKKKKGKVIQLKPAQQSPENYIKTQARTLPVVKCLVTKDWESTGICNIIVTRGHKNGNLTAGIYLVDLYCLGLKNAHYEFNLDPEDFEYIENNSGDMEICEYTLAHNIIYGAIAFAEDHGFKPHKDFAIAQFILENDDEEVELMELEFGFEGKPFYMKGPYDDYAKVNNIRNTLGRTAGEGNYTIIDDADEDDLVEDDDYNDDDENDEDLDEEIEASINMLKAINKVYEKTIRTTKGKELLKKSTIGKGYKITETPVLNEYNTFDDRELEARYIELEELFENDELEDAIEGLNEEIIKHPKPQFYNLLLAAYLFSEKFDEANEVTIEMYRLFPDFLFSKVAYANHIIQGGELEKAFDVFNRTTDLNYLYPGQKLFNVHEAAIYYATMCVYFIAAGDIDQADLYMNVILKKDLAYLPNQTIVSMAMLKLSEAKMVKIKSGELF